MPDPPSPRSGGSGGYGWTSWKFWVVLCAFVLMYTAVQVTRGVQTTVDQWGTDVQLLTTESFVGPFSWPTYGASDVERLISARSGLRGHQVKKGVLDRRVWMSKYAAERRSLGIKFLVDSLPSVDEDDRINEPRMVPLHWPECEVNVNHHYKFIFVKGKKVGGTSLRNHLGWICGDWWKVPKDTKMPHCSVQLHKAENISEVMLEEWWRDYFVFGIVRNPFTRFASGYTYLNTYMSACPKPSFKQTCYDPFIQAKICGVAGCCFRGSVGHHVHHMTDQNSCFFTAEGELAVDFIAETENLHDDFMTIVQEANKRRGEGVPPLEEDVESLHANANRKKRGGEDYEGTLFEQNPECIGAVAHVYQEDLQRLQYSTED
eukprot:evm.model.scf_1352.5 EVM.evm.TU.scf_1352.5   scf_1352:36873-37997(-)